MEAPNSSEHTLPFYENFEADDSISSECKALLPTLKRKIFWELTVCEYEGFWFLPLNLSSYLRFYNEFKPLDDDLIVSSLPKSGTTWMKALTFAIANRAQYPLTSPGHPLLHTNPHELVLMFEFEYYNKLYTVPDISSLPSPRLLGTHVPFQLFPERVKDSGCKIIYICRNPKDNFLSLWKFCKKIQKTTSGICLEEMFNAFCEGSSVFGPFWDHILGYWKASQERPERVLFLKYEDVKEDPPAYVKRLAEFMGCPISTQEERQGVVDQIVKLCSLETISNLEVNKAGALRDGVPKCSFFGDGLVGGSGSVLTTEMIKQVDDITKSKLPGFWV